METEKKKDGAATAPSLTQMHMHDGLAAPPTYTITEDATQHRVGEIIRQTARGTTHVYTLVWMEPHITATGGQTLVLYWQGRCVRCGETFEHSTGRKVRAFLNRTCKPCRTNDGGRS